MFRLAIHLAFIAAAAAAALPANSDVSPSVPRKIGKRCTGTIASLADVAAAEECTTIDILEFTVPAGETFSLSPPDGAVVSLNGTITFGFKNWEGPLMIIQGNSITFNGNNNILDGQGALYWDGLGTGGILKPDLMLRLKMGGTFENVEILNSPVRAISVDGSGTGLLVSGVTVNDAAAAVANNASAGKPAGANTDGFDVSASNVVIRNSVVINQDDCLAIKSGSNITFTNNSCTGGHGISIGSVESDVVVSDVVISDNIVINNVQALRIKTDATATAANVSHVVFTNNTATGTTFCGVIVDQSYPATLGAPGTGVLVSDVVFSGANNIAVDSTAHRVEVNCGSTSSCTGTWNFAGLSVTGGTDSSIKNAPVTGGSF